ncbi:MAG: hypothetical protein LBR37_03890 [Erysipelotrichaceae bacterium]|jgi:hypothetical protein|nr:hypothetical protein [Erysipelotrichaceae bacterium]
MKTIKVARIILLISGIYFLLSIAFSTGLMIYDAITLREYFSIPEFRQNFLVDLILHLFAIYFYVAVALGAIRFFIKPTYLDFRRILLYGVILLVFVGVDMVLALMAGAFLWIVIIPFSLDMVFSVLYFVSTLLIKKNLPY